MEMQMKKLCLFTAMGLLGIGSAVSGTLQAQAHLSVMPDKETLSSETRRGMMLAQAAPEEMSMPMTDNDTESGEPVKGRGTVVGMEKENRKVTLAHEAIAQWQWPPMTMTFDVAEDVDMSQLQEGSEVEFMAVRPEAGGQVVVEIGPVNTLGVYKNPSCGCCAGWLEHMDKHGFSTEVHHPQDLNAKKTSLGIKPVHQSCHTTVSAEGYVFEGHVPAKYVEQFLTQKPAGALGLAVPGMPLGSPGMEAGGKFTPYDILLLKKDGSSEIYASVKSLADQS